MSDGMVSERAAGDMFISAIRAQAMAHDTYISDRLSLVATQEFSQEQKREIWDMQWNGIPSSKIAKHFGVATMTIRKLMNRTSWPQPREFR